ncbi:phage tail tape measure protein [Nocardia sp. R7R-8]|uniref:phage tail tape measure protein n=1 Tax=Nocardia sp. R7R-8 TaxID=3459304 RepID=UPI00403DCAF4
MAVEVATAYVSLVVDTRGIPAQIRSAFGQSERDAQQSGQRMGNSLQRGASSGAGGISGALRRVFGMGERDAEASGQRMGNHLGRGIGGALGSLGPALLGTSAVAGLAASFVQVVKVGNEYTTSLNTMKAVTGATASEMAAVSERAKQLGNDITLPGTSASDAAAAMTELAKGGFSVQQSMDAAKGSLQLAAAAQISAGQAATIQSQALQAFGLQASDAGRVADVLANTANATSAEITDVALGLQQGGTVAKQFGLSIEDTATALGLFAQSGIRGSDAGTLLKSAMLAITDRGKPAQAAIEELGLKLYNAQGQFVGLRSMFDQLSQASKRMSPEMYQAATNVLFGSDAMRLAAVAADKGVAGYDRMHDAMSRTGSAADVAKAKMEGLPGAMQTVSNATENLSLEVYDLIKGPLEKFATNAAKSITDATPGIVDGLHTASDALVSTGRAVGPVVGWFRGLPAPVQAATAALLVFKTTMVGTWVTSGAAALQRYGAVASTFATTVATANGRVVQLAGVGATTLGRFGSAVNQLGTSVPLIGRMQTSFLNTTAAATAFARTQGTIAAAATGMRGAASGLVSFLGGPWVVATVAAGAALFQLWSEMKKGEEHAKALQSSLRELSTTRSELAEIFALNGGAFNDQAIQNVTRQIGTMKKSLDDAANFKSGFFEKAKGAVTFTLGDAYNKDWYAERWAGAKKIIDDLKMSDQQLAATLADQSKFDDLAGRLRGMGQDGRFALSELQALRDGIVRIQDAAKNTTPGFASLTNAVKTLADESADAGDRVNAMKTALDVMSGKPIAAQDALARYNDQLRDTAKATQEAWDNSQGFGQQLIGQNGQIDTATANGGRLYTELTRIRDATITAAEAGVELGPVFQRNTDAFGDLARATGLTAEQVRQLAAQVGYLPDNITILAQLRGADSVEQQLIAVQGLLRNNAQGVTIPTDALTEETKRKLTDLGVQIEAVNGKPGVVKVSAPDAQAVIAKLDDLIAKNLPDKTQRVKVEYDDSGYHLPQSTRERMHENIDSVPVAPRADGGIDGPLPSQATIQSPRARLYQWAEPETGGEAFIPLGLGKRSRSVGILGQVADMFGFGLVKMADGGVMPKGIKDALAAAGSASGKKYVWGGTGPTGFDCSGFIGWLQQIAMGIVGSTRRIYTTMSLLGGAMAGLEAGLGPSGTWFRVGVSQEHMAGTINGQAVESGGAFGTSGIGGGRAKAEDSQFPFKFHLPNELIAGWVEGMDAGTSGSRSKSKRKKAEWTDADETNLESANVAVQQAKERRDKVYADSKKSDADRQQADLAVKKAEDRVVKLQQKKDDAAGQVENGPAPQAPALERAYSDEELDRIDAQVAVDQANERRNEVYDDIDATDTDRLKADADLARARNRQAEVVQGKKDKGKDSKESQMSGRLRDFVTGMAGIAFDAVLEMMPFGFGELPIWKFDWSVFDPNKNKDKDKDKDSKAAESPQQAIGPLPTFNQDQILQQWGFNPAAGTPDWVPDWIRNIKVFDTGGWLEPGEVGINLSSRPEPIFNSPAQLQQFAAGTVSASTGPTMTVNNYGMDPQSSARAMERQWRRRTLADQYGGGFGR